MTSAVDSWFVEVVERFERELRQSLRGHRAAMRRALFGSLLCVMTWMAFQAASLGSAATRGLAHALREGAPHRCPDCGSEVQPPGPTLSDRQALEFELACHAEACAIRAALAKAFRPLLKEDPLRRHPDDERPEEERDSAPRVPKKNGSTGPG